jgi:hypothetical protein
MKKNRAIRRPVVLVCLLAGLALTAYALAQVAPRPKSAPHGLKFLAPATGDVAFYEARVTDVNRDSTYVVPNLSFEVLPGDGTQDTHLVYLDLTYHHLYRAQVRAFNARNNAGPWSEVSELYEKKSPYAVPER